MANHHSYQKSKSTNEKHKSAPPLAPFAAIPVY